MDLDKFLKYDEDNPEVWKEFESLALLLIMKGRKHYGAKAICEVIRYNTITQGNDEFKINNNYTMGYARKFALKYPQHKDFFELRQRRYCACGDLLSTPQDKTTGKCWICREMK